jgi:hypothetical protein
VRAKAVIRLRANYSSPPFCDMELRADPRVGLIAPYAAGKIAIGITAHSIERLSSWSTRRASSCAMRR